MNDQFYIERWALGTRVIELDGYWVNASGRFGSKKTRNRVDLRRASRIDDPASVRLWLPIGLCLGMALLPIPVIASDRVTAFLGPARFLEGYLILWTMTCLWFALKVAKRVEIAVIRSPSGDGLFGIIKDNKHPEDFIKFVEEIKMRIRDSSIRQSPAPT